MKPSKTTDEPLCPACGTKLRPPRPRGSAGRGPLPFGLDPQRPGEAAVVRRMKELKAGRQSLRKIANALNAEKARTRTGAKWSKMTVKTVLDRAGKQ